MNEKFFLELYQRQQESGLTVKGFCLNEAIAPATFYYWKKKMEEQNRLPGFIPVVVNGTCKATHDKLHNSTILLPASRQKEGSPFIEIEFPNKAIVRIKSELDLSMLKTLIHLND